MVAFQSGIAVIAYVFGSSSLLNCGCFQAAVGCGGNTRYSFDLFCKHLHDYSKRGYDSLSLIVCTSYCMVG